MFKDLLKLKQKRNRLVNARGVYNTNDYFIAFVNGDLYFVIQSPEYNINYGLNHITFHDVNDGKIVSIIYNGIKENKTSKTDNKDKISFEDLEKVKESSEYTVMDEESINTISKNIQESVSEDEILKSDRGIITYYFNGTNESTKDVFKNSLSSYASVFSIIKLSDIISTKVFTQETFDWILDNKDVLMNYIDDNYKYDVNFSYENNGEKHSLPLKIYEFKDGITGQESTHVGYEASGNPECDYIYDIIEKKIYSKPNLGECNEYCVSNFYDSTKITINGAKKLRENVKSSKKDLIYKFN